MIVAEALCLARSAANVVAPRAGAFDGRRPFAIAAALGAGAALFLIVALPALRTGASAFANGATGWIERPRWWAPLALFNKGVGSFAFPVMAALAGWGAWRGWVRARAATAFALAWMWLPPLLMLVASYAFSPMFVERYALWCFVPFFMLAALGAWELRSRVDARGRDWSLRLLSGARASPYLPAAPARYSVARGRARGRRRARARHENRGRAAVRGQRDALLSARYAGRRGSRARGDSQADDSDDEVLVVGDQWNAREEAAKLLAQYPHPLAAFRDVRVYGRGTRAQ